MGVLWIGNIIHSGFDDLGELSDGFDLLYDEPSPFPEEKLPFLRQPPSKHQLSFWRAKAGVSIERVVYGPRASGPWGPYQLIVSGPISVRPGVERKQDEVTRSLSTAMASASSRVLTPDGLSFLSMAKMAPFQGGVQLACRDLERVASFWREAFGFQFCSRAKASPQWSLLEFNTPLLKSRTALFLTETAEERPNSFLDDRGWTCLTLLVTDIERMLARLKELGAPDASRAFPFSVHQRSFKLAFVRGLSGELIELCEVL